MPSFSLRARSIPLRARTAATRGIRGSVHHISRMARCASRRWLRTYARMRAYRQTRSVSRAACIAHMAKRQGGEDGVVVAKQAARRSAAAGGIG